MNNLEKIIKEIVPYIVIVVVVILIRTLIETPVIVRGDSMYETLHDGEVLILSKISYKLASIKRYDIVVVKDNDDDYIIKRVIGLPGDDIEYKDNILYINGKEIEEDFQKAETKDFNITDLGYEKIPKDCYFVIGDNRNDSSDSRIIGCINKKNILGNANLVIYPLNDFGIKK